jgi:DNA invertase Pin-like site-specific DNA recombinase
MMMDRDAMPRPPGGLSEKILRRHRERLAIVYIRQSTVQQVERHQESTRLQYALVERAFDLGWARASIVVVDDDLGRSGATIEGRLGFQRLVAEVGLGRVGVVLGVAMSRLARSNRDWHQLLEICALFDTLIADVDGVYDPAHFNDRLLLGLKGTMSEAELHILKARMLAGRRAKARRGELGKPVPMGYVRRPSGEVALDPDEQAQATIRLVFALFERFRTVGKVLSYLVEHDIRMPVRIAGGPGKGELEWRRANRPTLHNLFGNPIYAGIYAYGVRTTERRRQTPGRPGAVRRVPARPRCSCRTGCPPTSAARSSIATKRSFAPTGRTIPVRFMPAPRCCRAWWCAAAAACAWWRPTTTTAMRRATSVVARIRATARLSASR